MKILAIDDNRDNLLILKAMIKDIFPDTLVFSAPNGAKGLELAVSEDPDVLLLDIVMPGMDGFEVCKKLKADKKLRDIPVVFITALKGDKENRVQALEAGADAFLAKPVEESELTAQIRAMIKIRTANIEKRDEKKLLTSLVEMQTRELKETHIATLNLLEDLRRENKSRQKSEEALRESEEWNKVILQTVLSGVIVIDVTNRKIVEVNDTALGLIGLPKEKVIGSVCHKFICPAEEKNCPILDLGKTVDSSERILLTADGKQKDIIKTVVPVNFRGSKYLIESFVDITERKLAEKEKANLELQLRESQKMQAVGQLAGGISHDFNNLLSVINGYAQMLLKSDVKSSTRPALEEILRAGERASLLTRQLLVFSRRQTADAKIVDLDSIISGMEKMLRRLIREDIDVKRNTGAVIWQIMADPGNIEQVIMNLFINASDAMQDGGTLTVETRNVKIDDTNCDAHPPGIKSGSYVMLSVSDTGCGMDDKIMEHIFEPFFTTKEVGKGTGLGLATVYGIVKQGNGYIDAQSELGKGTRFRIYFPQASGEAFSKEKQKEVAITPHGSETILLAEDEDCIRLMLKDFLKSIGYTVISACNGKEALEFAKNHKEPVHLLLTDVVMPGMNGFELAKQVKEFLPETKILFMSGYAKPTDTHKMMRINDNLIQKPIVLHALAVKLREILK
jgi:PAS domain S-box-containing protein